MMWDYGDDRFGRMHDQGGAGWFMVLLMLVVAVAVVVAIVALFRGTKVTPTPHAVTGTRAADPRAILQDRFARGEIDEQDYRARMRALDETGPNGS
jgi:putative membrane protein